MLPSHPPPPRAESGRLRVAREAEEARLLIATLQSTVDSFRAGAEAGAGGGGASVIK